MTRTEMNRRDLLRSLAAGAGGLGLFGWPSRGSRRFDELWQKMIEYNDVRNTAKTGTGYEAFSATQDQIRRWKEIRSLGENYFPESHLHRNNQNYCIYQLNFFQEQGKVYLKVPSAHKPKIDSIMLGTMYTQDQLKELIGTDGNESFEWKGQKADYNVIAFEQDTQSLDDILGGDDKKGNDDSIGSGSYLGYFVDQNKTAYINITAFKKSSKDIYDVGNLIDDLGDDGHLNPHLKMAKEVYDKIIEDIQQELGYSSISKQDKYKAFEQRFLKVMTRSWINHEKMHNFTKKEAEAWLYQASADPRYNAMVFLIAGDKYADLNDTLKETGYTREAIADMSSEERAQRMGEIFNEFSAIK